MGDKDGSGYKIILGGTGLEKRGQNNTNMPQTIDMKNGVQRQIAKVVVCLQIFWSVNFAPPKTSRCVMGVPGAFVPLRQISGR